MRCASKIVVPMAKLTTRPVIVIIICEPVETAETSSDWANLPTIRRSTAPYMACSSMAANTGSMNFSSGDKILPLVKSFSFIALSDKKDRIRSRHLSLTSYPVDHFF